ncbi:hypothetical protein ACHAWX_004470 [Stephanocyclus meneghinianus]
MPSTSPHLARGRPHLRRAVSILTILVVTAWIRSLSFLIQLQKEFDPRRGAADHEHTSAAPIPNKPPITQDIQSERRDASSSKDVHIVFSTDCSGYQHWQSIALYYSAKRSGHLGPVTRIASGCETWAQDEITEEWRKIDPTRTRFRVHFTPSFALVGSNYKYSNKPGGLHHWITRTDIQERFIALLDPDMMLLRPITPELRVGLTAVPVSHDRSSRNLMEYVDRQGTVQFLRRGNLPELPLRVEEGMAAGQHFGIGTLWVSSGMKDARKDFRNFNLTAVCGKDSPCLNTPRRNNHGGYTTREQAENYYSVGPIYICAASNWRKLLPRWHEFTPSVHAQYPKLLAEMYAFTMAAADRELKFALASSWMVSDAQTMSPTESWLWIDEYGKKSESARNIRTVCDGATSNSLPTETLGRIRNYGYGNYNGDTPVYNGPLPVTLHYCQRYLFANHTFAKHKMRHDFFRCDGDPLMFDTEAVLKALNSYSNDKVQKRTAFMICHLIPLMNMALGDYKRDVCIQ